MYNMFFFYSKLIFLFAFLKYTVLLFNKSLLNIMKFKKLLSDRNICINSIKQLRFIGFDTSEIFKGKLSNDLIHKLFII